MVHRRWPLLTEAQRPQAMARCAVLRPHRHEGIPLAAVARAAGVPVRSVQRWLARSRAAGLVGLARAQRSDTGHRTLPAALVQVIDSMALRTPRPSIAAMHRRMTALVTQHHWTPPSYGSV
jgi:putative transposase